MLISRYDRTMVWLREKIVHTGTGRAALPFSTVEKNFYIPFFENDVSENDTRIDRHKERQIFFSDTRRTKSAPLEKGAIGCWQFILLHARSDPYRPRIV